MAASHEFQLNIRMTCPSDVRMLCNCALRQGLASAFRKSSSGVFHSTKQETGSRIGVVFAAQKGFKPSKKMQNVDESSPNLGVDPELQKRLAAIQRTIPVVRPSEVRNDMGPLDYDAPPPITTGQGESGTWTDKPATKVAFGIAAGLFALIFAFGDILPSSVPRNATQPASERSLSREERGRLELQVKRFSAQLAANGADRDAIEGLAVSYAELGQYEKASDQLVALTKEVEDVEALRLLAEVRAAQRRFGDSVQEYRRALRAQSRPSFSLLQGLSEALIADGKADEAVQEILVGIQSETAESNREGSGDGLEAVQVRMLLGRAYAACGKGEEAETVFDELIAAHPDDFRGYLAKAALLRQQGRAAEATRLFVQARNIAPEETKGIVDKVAAQG